LNTPRHGPTGAAYRAARRAGQIAAALALAAGPGIAVTALLLPLAASGVEAQSTARVTGTVTSNGQPVVDAQVVLQGTQFGARTNDQGRFSINGAPTGSYVLRVQRLGYTPSTQSVTVVSSGQLIVADFTLVSAPTQLTTQVVVGYTTEQRRDVSGAVSSVRAEDIADQKVATVEEALRGRIPGVQIAASGQPGRPAAVVIRGQNGFGNPSPLYVVDGMYIGQQNPNINPDDIASIDVLKDASAAAQYGAQASNGVIVITTRKGQSGPSRIDFSTYYGSQTVPNRLDLAGSSEFQRVFQQAYANANASLPADKKIPVPLGVSQSSAVSTNWQDAVFQTGSIQNYNLTASGGTPTASYLISGSMLDQGGTVINTNFRRYSVRANSEARRGRLTIGENLAVSQARQQSFSPGIFGGTALPLIDIAALPPTIPVYDPNNPSGYGYGSDATPNYGTNPVAAQNSNYNKFRSSQVLGSAFANVGLIGGLSYRLNLGLNYNDSLATYFQSSQQLRYLTPVIDGATLRESAPQAQQLLYENLLTYEHAFGDGSQRLTAVAGQTSQNNTYRQLTAARTGFANENLQQLNAGATSKANNGGFLIPFRSNALLARATYAFHDRYLLSGSARRDCSSRFSAGNRCGSFGAGSVGWVASEEGFWNAIPVLRGADFFKLRASMGVLGDQGIGDFAYTVPVEVNKNYRFGQEVGGGAAATRLANTSLKWQRNQSQDVGIDLGIHGDLLSITADYYVNNADQLLVAGALPPSLASSSNPVVNAGKVRNAGFEFGATNRLNRGDLRFNTTLTLTTTSNRVVSLGNGGQDIYSGGFSGPGNGVTRTTVGQPIGEFFLKETCGLFQSAADVASHKAQPAAVPGDLCVVDQNGDNRIDDKDRVNAGSPIPKVSGGLFFDTKYKSVDVGVNLRGVAGNKIYNAVAVATERTVGLSNVVAGYNPWTPTNTNTSTPIAVFGDPHNNGDPVTTRWLEKGDFLRIQNLIVGYTLPARLTQRLGTAGRSEPRIYFNVQNLYTFTKYSGFDPEVLGFGDPLARGVDDGYIYPNARTITVGADLHF
jgi:TonB-dependent starch-binding outer membrane protein SusC